jgi:hypothetical protein
MTNAIIRTIWRIVVRIDTSVRKAASIRTPYSRVDGTLRPKVNGTVRYFTLKGERIMVVPGRRTAHAVWMVRKGVTTEECAPVFQK